MKAIQSLAPENRDGFVNLICDMAILLKEKNHDQSLYVSLIRKYLVRRSDDQDLIYITRFAKQIDQISSVALKDKLMEFIDVVQEDN